MIVFLLDAKHCISEAQMRSIKQSLVDLDGGR